MLSNPGKLIFALVAVKWVAVLMLLDRADAACFDNHAVLEDYATYIQPLSLENRLYYYPDGKELKVKSEPNVPGYVETYYTCVKEYSKNRMKVQVTENGVDVGFQCLQFKTVAQHVVRLAKSRRGKVNCKKEKYTTDQAVLVVMDLLETQPCPLLGGYQMLLHEGEIIKGHCLDSVYTYNPNLRFQCDNYNVIADFGQDCEPPILRKFQKMRQRHIAHLTCVASWSETKEINAILLRMRDQPYDLWCIHYKQVNGSYDVLSIFITLDGRCVEGAFHNEDFPKKTSLFGQLVKYVPSDDPRCSKSNYLDECKANEAVCFDSNECPSNCQRCNANHLQYSRCYFQVSGIGHWEMIDSRYGFSLDMEMRSFKVDKYGEFSCYGDADRDLKGLVYPVVQANYSSSCLPYYACALVVNPFPGVLFFKLSPAWRDEATGKPFTCKQTHDRIGHVTPATDERMVTLMNTEKLVETQCRLRRVHKFPTVMVDKCMLVVSECRGNCSVFKINYDNDTCGNQSTAGFPIETTHKCYGRIIFSDGIIGLFTYSDFSQRYMCWLYSVDRLLITTPANCNIEGVRRIFGDSEASMTYDPALALSKPVSGGSSEGGDGNNSSHRETLHHVSLVIFLYSFILLSF